MARPTTALILAVSMLAAACGSGGDGGEATGAGGDPDAHIRVNMTEYGFGSDVIEVRAGQTVEFLLKNSGDLDHEFMIGREVTVGMDGHGHDDGSMETDTDGHDDGHHGFMVTLGPGATASVTVTIPDDAVGDWEIGCFLDKGSHWSSGMHATLRVRA